MTKENNTRCLALQVGGRGSSVKIVTKNYAHILRTVLDVAKCISQFFLRLSACIFHLQKIRGHSRTSSWRTIHLLLTTFQKKWVHNSEMAGHTPSSRRGPHHIKHDFLLKFIDFPLFLKTTSKRYPLPRHA